MGSEDALGKAKKPVSINWVQLIVALNIGAAIGMLIADKTSVVHHHTPRSLQECKCPCPLSGGSGGLVKAEDVGGAVSKSSEPEAIEEDALNYTDSKPARSDLETYLRKIAPQREVLVAVANKNVLWGGMMDTFSSGLKQAGVKNHVIVALDEETKQWADKNDVNAWLLKVKIHDTQKDTGDNHAVSAMKFGILKNFVELGWSVLLSDVDICVLRNPFDYLYRDHDIEGMTDGFDERTAYGSIEGFVDPSMGWAQFAQFYKRFNLNSGLFWLKGNKKNTDLMERLETRLSKQQYWDQTAYNEEIFFMSHGDYISPRVVVRVMDIDKFMNSKRLFKDVRKRPLSAQPPMPVTVHINYHPDKHERMKAVNKYYLENDKKALDSFPGGSEKGTK